MSQMSLDTMHQVDTINELKDDSSADSISAVSTPNAFEEMLKTAYFEEVNLRTPKGERFMVDKYTPHKILN